MHKVETQHLELQVNLSTWLHTVEVQHRVMDNLVHVDQVQIILQELAQVAEVKVTGRIRGAVAEAVVAQAALESIQTYSSLTLEDIQDIMVEVEVHQKDLQVEDQDGQTQMILEEELLEDVEAQVFMD
jgi:hypothetical protein